MPSTWNRDNWTNTVFNLLIYKYLFATQFIVQAIELMSRYTLFIVQAIALMSRYTLYQALQK